ncbi:MAG: glycosyltransferase family 4 protein [Pseudomonadota bacterium]
MSTSQQVPTKARKLRIAISINSTWNFLNFRAGLIRHLVAKGHEVIAIAPADENVGALENLGCRFVDCRIASKSINPFEDIALEARYRRILSAEQPDAFLGFTIKPNVYGSLAAHRLGIPVINNVSGLGTAFIRDNWLQAVVARLYRAAFRRSKVVFFQNRDDREAFVAKRLVLPEQVQLLPGSGIDLDAFAPMRAAGPAHDGRCRFLFIGRLVHDKGLRELVAAARIVRQKRTAAQFRLLGFLDVANRTAVTRAEVDQWVAEGVVDYLGPTDDVRPHIARSDCVVLPSYREGTPRALLEAAAMAKPVVATDVPGCRQAVDDGETGFLCRARDADDLADKLIAIIDLGAARRQEMGAAGRRKVEREFAEQRVIDAYLRALDDCLGVQGDA